MSLRRDQLVEAFLCRKLFWLIINDLYDNKTWVSNLGANKLPPKNVLFRRLKEKGILWYSIRHLSFTLSHKLVCVLFVSYQPSDKLKKSSFHLFPKRHFSKAFLHARWPFLCCHHDYFPKSRKHAATFLFFRTVTTPIACHVPHSCLWH